MNIYRVTLIGSPDMIQGEFLDEATAIAAWKSCFLYGDVASFRNGFWTSPVHDTEIDHFGLHALFGCKIFSEHRRRSFIMHIEVVAEHPYQEWILRIHRKCAQLRTLVVAF